MRRATMLTIESSHALNVLERGSIEALVRRFWDERLIAAEPAIRNHASPDIVFRILSGPSGPLTFDGVDAVVEGVRGIDVNLEFVSFEVLDLIVDGARVALLWHATLRNRGTGVCGDLAVFDLITVQDGKIVSYLEYFDTDGFARLMAGEPQPDVARRANSVGLTPVKALFVPAAAPSRGEVESLLRTFWADRIGRGGAAIALHCTDEVELHLIGDQSQVPFARRHVGLEAARALVDQIDIEFEMLSHRIVDVLVDGPRAAVRWAADVRHRGTGMRGHVECFEHVVTRGGRIASITEFFDTAATASWIAG
jgi:ketosteroid isomerase-like protein